MPNQTATDAVVESPPEFVPYTLDIRTREQHESLHTSLGMYMKSLEGLAKKMTANGVDKTGVVALLGVCEDTLSALEGQYTLFNAVLDAVAVEPSDTRDMFGDGHPYPYEEPFDESDE